MVMKCARVGIPLIASKAAILDSAIEVYEKSGVAASKPGWETGEP